MREKTLQFGRAFLSGGLLVGIIDAIFLFASRKMFFDTGEMVRTALFVLAMDVAAALILGLSVFGAVSLAQSMFSRLEWDDRPRLRIAASASVFLGPFVFILLRLTAGPKASLLPGRFLWVLLFAALFSGGLATFAVAVPDWISRSNFRKKSAIGLFAAASIGLSAIDAWVLVRLYPVFHGTLTLLSFLAVGAGFVLGPAPLRTRWGKIAVAAAIVLSLGIGVLSMVKVSKTQNIRFVIGYATPNASDVWATVQSLFSSKERDETSVDTDLDNSFGSTGKRAELSLPGSDVFLISIDAMRYDRLKALGAKREIAPNIDRFSEKAVLFERAYTAIPHTSYAVTSLLTGKFTRPLFEVPGAPPVHETWPEIMHRFRYDTAAFFPPAIFFIDRARFEPYLRSGLGFSYRKVEAKQTAEERADALTAYLEEKKASKNPLFAWIHFFEPHEPYDASCTRFGTADEDRYDCEIWTVDKAVGRLLSYLAASRPKSIVIITADHGEEFSEHGGRFHGTTLFDEQVRVPLLMQIPGVSPRSVQTPVSLTDLLGTVLSIVDIPPPARARSRDLTEVIVNGDGNLDAYAEVHDEAMVVYGGDKIICDTKADLCRVYDLKADPRETRSIAEQNPQKTTQLKTRLLAWRRSHARFELRPVSSEKGAEKWPDAIKRALSGDIGAIDGLVDVISSTKETVIRQKAAELVFRLSEQLPKSIALKVGEADPETDAWITATRAKFGDEEARGRLSDVAAQLDRQSAAFRETALLRLRFGDSSAYEDVLSVALDDEAAVEVRQQAIRALASVEKRRAADKLIPLIDNYQLTLDTAETLGRLKIKAAVDPLIARLKRERFLERKAAILDALSRIGDWRAVRPMADELFNDTPPPNALRALLQMMKPTPFGLKLVSKEKKAKGHKSVFYRPVPKGQFTLYLKKIQRVVVRASAPADGGEAVVFCGKVKMGAVPMSSGSIEGVVEVSQCRKRPGKPFEISVSVDRASEEASIDMVAILGK